MMTSYEVAIFITVCVQNYFCFSNFQHFLHESVKAVSRVTRTSCAGAEQPDCSVWTLQRHSWDRQAPAWVCSPGQTAVLQAHPPMYRWSSLGSSSTWSAKREEGREEQKHHCVLTNKSKRHHQPFYMQKSEHGVCEACLVHGICGLVGRKAALIMLTTAPELIRSVSLQIQSRGLTWRAHGLSLQLRDVSHFKSRLQLSNIAFLKFTAGKSGRQ